MSDSPIDDDAAEEALRHILAFGDLQDTLETFAALGRAAAHALLDATLEYDTPEGVFGAAGRAIADWAKDGPHAANLRLYAEKGLPTLSR